MRKYFEKSRKKKLQLRQETISRLDLTEIILGGTGDDDGEVIQTGGSYNPPCFSDRTMCN